MQDGKQMARGLGWFSLGLGLSQLVYPGEVARLIGVRDDPTNRLLMRGLGLREVACGLGLLSQRRPTGWAMARVAGDAMDLALLKAAFSSPDSDPLRLLGATAAVLGVATLDVRDGVKLAKRHKLTTDRAADGSFEITRTVRVNRPLGEVYAFWRDFQNLPRFVPHLKSVTDLGGDRSHWRVEGPGGTVVEWDAELVDVHPDKRIAWRSLEGADVKNLGVVRFAAAPAGRGTDVTVHLRYAPPAGAVGRAVATLFGKQPEHQVKEALRAFRQVMEAGETPWSDAWSSPVHPGRPTSREVPKRTFPGSQPLGSSPAGATPASRQPLDEITEHVNEPLENQQ